MATTADGMDGSGQEVQSVVLEVLVHQGQDDLEVTRHKGLSVLLGFVVVWRSRHFADDSVPRRDEEFAPFRKT